MTGTLLALCFFCTDGTPTIDQRAVDLLMRSEQALAKIDRFSAKYESRFIKGGKTNIARKSITVARPAFLSIEQQDAWSLSTKTTVVSDGTWLWNVLTAGQEQIAPRYKKVPATV